MPNHRSFVNSTRRIMPICLLVALVLGPSLVLAGAGDSGAGLPFNGVSLKIPNETVPPGGMLQLKVLVTEPKPILKGGQRLGFSSQLFGKVRGIALFSAAGDASGVAVLKNGSAQLFLSSPLSSLGTNVDYPILTIAVPVLPTASAGQTARLRLDPKISSWFDPSSQNYAVELKSGVMTVGGTLSISDVVPGGGVVPAGATIAIKGIGFQPTSVVDVNEVALATSRYIGPNEIDITLATSADMTARRVRVTNTSNNETAIYYSYQRTLPLGRSTHQLIAASYPLFASSTWTQAYFKPVLSGTTFSGLALQNLTASTVGVRLELYSSQGGLLTARNLQLPANMRLIRDLVELLPGALPETGTTLRVLAGVPIQMLGVLADDASGTVLPVDPAPAP